MTGVSVAAVHHSISQDQRTDWGGRCKQEEYGGIVPEVTRRLGQRQVEPWWGLGQLYEGLVVFWTV